MSIVVNQLTKKYGEQKAVDNLSFAIDKNEIVGFLGPNGAGKSTTLKIATGYLSASSGNVLIGGLDVAEQPLEIKKKIGYLPEHNPLYLNMYVHEYLHFSGKFYGISGKKLKSRTAEVIEMCQLQLEQNKKIGQLSKGYRQRVGLAQALLHEPEVLILDEPTTGLDPNQIVEVRDLIKTISKDRTVLFSTHIMQEVQAICNRVIIINQGKLVADDSLTSILHQQTTHTLEIEFESEIAIDTLSAIEDVEEVKMISKYKYLLKIQGEDDIRKRIMKTVADNNLPLIGINRKEMSMEEVFNSLTQVKENV
jgi:ABC-2 type transport system ATP-binding protein